MEREHWLKLTHYWRERSHRSSAGRSISRSADHFYLPGSFAD